LPTPSSPLPTQSSPLPTPSSPTPAAAAVPSGKKACKFGYKPNPNKYKKDQCATCGMSEASHASVMEELAKQKAKEEEEKKKWDEEVKVRRAKEDEELKIVRAKKEEEKKKRDEEEKEWLRKMEEKQKLEDEAEKKVWAEYEAALARGENPKRPKPKMLKQYQILDWVVAIAARFGVKVTGFESPSWTSGLAFAALIANFRPDLIDITKLDPNDGVKNIDKAVAAAEKLGFNSLLDAEDVQHADDKSIATQVFALYRHLWDLAPIKDPVPQARK